MRAVTGEQASRQAEPEISVVLRARSAVRFREGHELVLLADPASEVPVTRTVISNDDDPPRDDGLHRRGIRIVVTGRGDAFETAANVFAGIGAGFAHVLAVAANASIEEPELALVYQHAPAGGNGSYVQRVRANTPISPAVVVTPIDAELAMRVLTALDKHPEQDRLRRAMEHYTEALRHLHPFQRIRWAEALFIAAENLGPVILRRLIRDAGLEGVEDAKSQLAVTMGYALNPDKPSEHLYKLDSEIRRREIFQGDAAAYRNLKAASDGFEHGYSDFAAVRKAVEQAGDAPMSYLREAILRELSLPPDDFATLTGPDYTEALGSWGPEVEVTGHFSSKSGSAITDFGGLSLTLRISRLAESLPTRSADITMEGDRQAVQPDVNATVEGTNQVMPATQAVRKRASVGGGTVVVKHSDGTADTYEGQTRIVPPDTASGA